MLSNMGFQGGHKRFGGRKKGTPNKRSHDLIEALKEHNFDPAENLVNIVNLAMDHVYNSLPEYAEAFLRTALQANSALMQFTYPRPKKADPVQDKQFSFVEIAKMLGLDANEK
jgi:hypothetical protein